MNLFDIVNNSIHSIAESNAKERLKKYGGVSKFRPIRQSTASKTTRHTEVNPTKRRYYKVFLLCTTFGRIFVYCIGVCVRVLRFDFSITFGCVFGTASVQNQWGEAIKWNDKAVGQRRCSHTFLAATPTSFFNKFATHSPSNKLFLTQALRTNTDGLITTYTSLLSAYATCNFYRKNSKITRSEGRTVVTK